MMAQTTSPQMAHLAIPQKRSFMSTEPEKEIIHNTLIHMRNDRKTE